MEKILNEIGCVCDSTDYIIIAEKMLKKVYLDRKTVERKFQTKKEWEFLYDMFIRFVQS